MKSNYFYLSLLILFLFVCSCNDFDDLVSSNNEEGNVVDNSCLSDLEMVAIKTLGRSSTSIGSEEAEQIACDFFNKKVKQSSVQLKSFSTNTLGKCGKDCHDTLCYVVEFEGDEGFAIVSGDVRMPQEILAYSNSGVFDTVNDPGLAFFMGYLSDYYDRCALRYDEGMDTLSVFQSLDSCKLLASTTLSKKTAPYAYSISDIVDEFSTYSSWRVTSNIGPLVPVTWEQSDDYNDYLQLLKDKDKLLGCTSLATAQLMAYWKHPSHFEANGVVVDWDLITKYPNIDSFSNSSIAIDRYAVQQIQTFCCAVSMFCHTIYLKNNSPSLPKNSLQFLSDWGYSVPDGFVKYSKDRLVSSIQSGMPVIAYGANKKTNALRTGLQIATLGIVNVTIPAHVWLMDGYCSRERSLTKYVKYKVPANRSSSIQKKAQSAKEPSKKESQSPQTPNSSSSANSGYVYETKEYHLTNRQEFVHINWGWGWDASCSWYLPDVFDCSEGYNRYGDSFIYGNYSSKNEYSRVHIATNIHPL